MAGTEPDAQPGRTLDCGGKPLDLSRPRVMGILNVTPDSFSDGGQFFDVEQAVNQAHRMVAEGAAIIDVGGESTRPGAEPVSVTDELGRILPVIHRLSADLEVPISVDTSKPEVMREAVAAGAGLVNDVMALRCPGALEAAKETGVPVCLMHMQGEPGTMQRAPEYPDVVESVIRFLSGRAGKCMAAGIERERILLDPGFGFGKTLAHNLQLLRHLDQVASLGFPVLVGLSRKSMLGNLLGGVPPERRLSGSLAAAVLAVAQGARLVRAHDVRETAEALQVAGALIE